VERASRQELLALLEFFQATYAIRDTEAFTTHVLSALSTLIPAEITSYSELDLDQRQCTLWLVEPSDAATPDDQRVFEAHASEQPLIGSYVKTRDGGAHKNSDFLTRSQFHQTALYNEFYRRVRMEHTMAIHLPGAPSLIVGIALHRALTNFSERDRQLLNFLLPHLREAYRNTQAVSRMKEELTLLRHLAGQTDEAVILLSKTGRVKLLTPRAQQWLESYLGALRADRLPEGLEAWFRQQEATVSRLDLTSPPRMPLVIERADRQLIVRHLCEGDHCCLLLHEQQAPSPRALERLGLTRRQAEALFWAAQGKTNREIGRILTVAPRTVEAYLSTVYKKLGVENRFAAIRCALTLLGGL
jgi:DNA-binding CsgD family transcriptional regulator